MQNGQWLSQGRPDREQQSQSPLQRGWAFQKEPGFLLLLRPDKAPAYKGGGEVVAGVIGLMGLNLCSTLGSQSLGWGTALAV